MQFIKLLESRGTLIL